ncbi:MULTISPECIES: heavy metal translocating P-type ATPase [unclassified Novosphingobium]|uniref:heavy metal translocating P-type ATPase n=1 Tax=unclassified Novosphingobium TaxID=2644732 RepID=UPI000AA72496|nr:MULTISPECIES: heavy metal translocating P-type ATPase [unclassified Novosphingobium]
MADICCGSISAPASLDETVPSALSTAPEGGSVARLRIAQMDCPTEEALIRKKLGAMDEVRGLEFNLMQRMLTVAYRTGALPAVQAAIRELGMDAEPVEPSGDEEPQTEAAKPWWPYAAGGLAALVAEIMHWSGLPEWTVALVAVLAVAVCGLDTYRKGWIALRHGNLNINALMSIAVTGALLIRQWPEAAMVMVLFAIAELIEAKSLDRARNAIRSLVQLAPDYAAVRQPDGSWSDQPAASVALGAIIRIKPGQRVALDGTITSGHSTLNQAAITGESMPVEKAPGDQVFAGTLNEAGSFEYEVTADAAHSTLARIIEAVESAQGARAPTQRFVDQFARIYTPAVFLVAVAVAIVPPLLLAGNWQDWIYKALVLLVIACPCALVISTPVTIVSGLAAAARRGILIKGGVYLEQGHRLAVLALDKTGTITRGKPALTDTVRFDPDNGIDNLDIATSLAARSDHPVSYAIADAGRKSGIVLLDVTDFAALPGRGVKGRIGGVEYLLGNHRLIHETGVCSLAVEAQLTQLEAQGKSVVVLTDGKQPLILLAVADTIKESSRVAIQALRDLGIETVMLTGDNARTAAAIAQLVGIDKALGDQLPEDKLQAIERYIRDGRYVGMVGDGINDAPALARADIGFAMGAAGSDTAIETADVALMDDDLNKIGRFVQISRMTRTVLIQNITLALGIKAVFLVLTVLGYGTMWMAVFADMGASLLVVANGLRLVRQ